MNTNPSPKEDLGSDPFHDLLRFGVPIFFLAALAIQAIRPQKVQSSAPASKSAVQSIKAAEKPVESAAAVNLLANAKLLTDAAMNKTWGGASALQEEFNALANMVISTSKEDRSGSFARFRKVFTVGNSSCTVEVMVDKNTGRPRHLTFQDRQIKPVKDSANFDIAYDLKTGDESVSGKYLPVKVDSEEPSVPVAVAIEKKWWLKLLAKCLADCREFYGW